MKKVTILVLASLFISLTIGCGGSDDDKPKKDWGQRLAEGLIETAIEQSAKQDGKDIDVDIDFDEIAESGSLTITGENGEKISLSGKDGVFKMTDNEGNDISITGKDGELVMKDKDGKETTILAEYKEIPSDFPKDVYMYDGEFKTAGIMNTGEGEVTTIVIKVDDDIDDIALKIKKKMKSEGWEKEMNMETGKGFVQSYKKDGRSATISASQKKEYVELSYMVIKQNEK